MAPGRTARLDQPRRGGLEAARGGPALPAWPGHPFSRANRSDGAAAIEAAGGRIARTDGVIHAYPWLRLELTETDRRLAAASVTGVGESARDWVDLGVAQLMDDGMAEARASFERAFEATRDPDAAFFLAGLTRDDPEPHRRLLADAIDGNRDDSSPWFDCADALERLALAHERLGN